jgi:hypothetical protein
MKTATNTGPLECLVGRLQSENAALRAQLAEVAERAADMATNAADEIDRLQADLEMHRRFEMFVVGEGAWDRFRQLEAMVEKANGRTRAKYRKTLDTVAAGFAKKAERNSNG